MYLYPKRPWVLAFNIISFSRICSQHLCWALQAYLYCEAYIGYKKSDIFHLAVYLYSVFHSGWRWVVCVCMRERERRRKGEWDRVWQLVYKVTLTYFHFCIDRTNFNTAQLQPFKHTHVHRWSCALFLQALYKFNHIHYGLKSISTCLKLLAVYPEWVTGFQAHPQWRFNLKNGLLPTMADQ